MWDNRISHILSITKLQYYKSAQEFQTVNKIPVCTAWYQYGMSLFSKVYILSISKN